MEGWRGRSGSYLLVFGLIRISWWIDDEEERTKGKGEMGVQYVVFDMGAVSSIDTSGTSMLAELKKSMDRRGMQVRAEPIAHSHPSNADSVLYLLSTPAHKL